MTRTRAQDWAPLSHVSVGNIRVALASRSELTTAMVIDCRVHAQSEATGPRLVFDCNGHAISLARTDPDYRCAMDQADVIHADGGVVVLASRFVASAPIAERSGTTDLIHDFAAAAEREGLSFYLLGGTEEVNSLCVEKLASLYPSLRIVGRRHGYFGAEEEEDVVAEIAAAAPDILWIGLGKPREQMFAARYRDRLNAAWAVTCGGCFNYITGHYRRAPQWMQRMHLEWLHRAMSNPRQLLRRYLTTSPHALWIMATCADRRIYEHKGTAINSDPVRGKSDWHTGTRVST